jgi:hypothetical protein
LQVLRFLELKAGLKLRFSLAKPRFLAEIVQKLKFPNNSILPEMKGLRYRQWPHLPKCSIAVILGKHLGNMGIGMES